MDGAPGPSPRSVDAAAASAADAVVSADAVSTAATAPAAGPVDSDVDDSLDDFDGVEEDGDDAAPEDEQPDIEDMSAAQFQGHEGPVYSVAASHNGVLAASGDGEDKAYVWRVADGSQLHELIGHTDSVSCLQFNRNDSLLATGALDGTVRVWDVASGALVRVLEGPAEDVDWLCWHSKGDVLLAGSADFTTWLWDATSGKCLHVFAGHEGRVTAGCFGAAGKRVLTCSEDGTARLWDPKSGSCEAVFSGHGWHAAGVPVNALAVCRDKPLLLTGGLDGTARLANFKTKRIIGTFQHALAASAAIEPGSLVQPRGDGRAAGSGDDDDAADGEDDAVSVEAVGFCESQPWVATAGSDGLLRIWDTSSMACRHTLRQPHGIVKLLWHPSTPVVYTCSVDGTVWVWDARAGECLRTFTGPTESVLDVALGFDDSGDFVVAASEDGEVYVFRM